MNIFKNIAANLFQPGREYTAGQQIFYRLFELFVTIYVIKFSWQWGIYMQRNTEVILPLGLANYVDVTFLFSHSLSLVGAACISLLVITAFFRMGSRWQYLLAMLLFHLQYAGRYSQGEIPHSANLVGLSLLCFGVGFIAFNSPHRRQRFILGSIVFFTGLGYTTAAFSKLIGTGFNWADGNHLWLWLAEKKTDILSRTGGFDFNAIQELALRSRTWATLILGLGWITEFFGFLFWWRRLRPYIATALIFTHIGITITMNIRFDAFVYELILLGYPWAKWIDSFIFYIPDGFKNKTQLSDSS